MKDRIEEVIDQLVEAQELVPGQTYRIVPKPFKAVDGKTYNVFFVGIGGRGWQALVMWENVSGIPILVKFIEAEPPDPYGIFSIVKGKNATIRTISRRPYVSKKTGKSNPVTGNDWFDNRPLRNQYGVFSANAPDLKLRLHLTKNQFEPVGESGEII